MNLFEDTTPKPLKQLLGEMDACEAALPDFQRDFVWEPSATQELIVSIASNYLAGSLLRIRNTHQLIAYREFEGSPKLNSYTSTELVLDGQLRRTPRGIRLLFPSHPKRLTRQREEGRWKRQRNCLGTHCQESMTPSSRTR